jgi:2-succinyl-5-enolpyruvyl-6-hydroxy-3-cyclohexene-1-carboxylate synthase
MTSTTDTDLLLRAFVDELARCGMRAACTSPGSRSAPLVLSLARDPRLRCYSHVDERCAGFFALGMAKASGLPVAVTCTSGTAAAQLLAPAIEAREARVPLLLLTADRPAELRENGAGQAIDQLKLYGSAAKWFFEVELPPAADDAARRWIRTLACRAYATALEGAPGVVHLNFPLREPLVGDQEPPPDASGRADGGPFVRRHPAPPADTDLETLSELAGSCPRGLIVAGRYERDASFGPAVAELARAAGWPLLADPLSGARRGDAAIAHYDAILRHPGALGTAVPDLILRVGDLPVSKPLREWLASLAGTQQVALDPEGAWQDPASTLSANLAIDPVRACERLALEPAASDPGWLEDWRVLDTLAAEALDEVITTAGLSEPAVAAALGELGPEATLFVASSMPVRDIETFWAARSDPPRVLCNRGANGIDGIVSSAFGAAAASDGPVVLLIGDVALAHDIGGLLAAARLGLKLTIVLIENGGGGIFDFLALSRSPMARRDEPSAVADSEADLYTRHVATPTGLDFARAAALYGLCHERAADMEGFRTALGRALAASGSTVVEVPSEREANVRVHARAWEAVGAALSRPAAAAAPGA